MSTAVIELKAEMLTSEALKAERAEKRSPKRAQRAEMPNVV
jgi:hypothetical protein